MRDEDLADPRPVDTDEELAAALRGEESVPASATESDPLLSSKLVDDVAALVADGKTYVEAELAFQKTRIAFAANRSKSALLSGLFALAFVHLALIALVVGAVIALTPLVTAWGATAIVVGLLLLGAFLLVLRMRNSTREIGSAFESDQAEDSE